MRDIRNQQKREEAWLKREADRRAKAELERAKAKENPSDDASQ
jgi:hypothetical protein